MSYSYERVDRQRRTAIGAGYVSAAAIGVAAWIWSERRDDEDESSDEEYKPSAPPPPGSSSMAGALPPGPGPAGFQGPPAPGPIGPGGYEGPPMPPSGSSYEGGARSTEVDTRTVEDGTLMNRMSGAFKWTPNPQQSYDWASKKVAAGVAAAGAMVGGALTTIREGSQDGYEDHERWSEEATSRDQDTEIKRGIKRRGTADEYFSGAFDTSKPTASESRKRKSVAVVVSATEGGGEGVGELGQHGSILLQLPEHINHEISKVFVLIYAPELKVHPFIPTSVSKPAHPMAQESRTSSFSNISHGDAHTPGDPRPPGEFPGGSGGSIADIDPTPDDDSSSTFRDLYNQALALVEKDAMIMPFTSPNGHLHLLRSLAPELIYLPESLCGENGEIADRLSGWVKQTVVILGTEGGHGGLVDTDDEDGSGKAHADGWWQKDDRTGLGKRLAVVDSLKVGDDWRRRIAEFE